MIVYEYVCVKCGAHYLSDEEHQCAQKSKPSKKPTTSPVTKTIASSRNSPSSRRTVDPPVSTLVSTPSRLAEWRSKNREAYNAYMREWRLRKKQEKP